MSIRDLISLLKSLPKDSVVYGYQIEIATSKDSVLIIKSNE